MFTESTCDLPEGPDVEIYVDPIGFLVEVDRWVEVRGPVETIAASIGGVSLAEPAERVVVEVDTRVIDGSEFGGSRRESVALQPSSWAAFEWVLNDGGAAFIAYSSQGSEREAHPFPLVRTKDGAHFFAAPCDASTFTGPLRAHLGDDFDLVVEKIIGVTDRRVLAALLLPEAEPTPTEQPVILNPEDVPPSVLKPLAEATLAITIPNDWLGMPFTLCPKIPTGWNDCLDLAVGRDTTETLGVFLDDEMLIDFWLLDEGGHLLDPIQLLASLDLSSVKTSNLEVVGGVVIEVSLSGSMAADASSGQPVSSPAVHLGSTFAWNELLADADLYEQVTGEELHGIGNV